MQGQPSRHLTSPHDLQTLIFLHIGRTGGTTLNHILERQFTPCETFALDSRDIGLSKQSLSEMSLSERGQLRLVTGHMDYGIHEELPGPSAYMTLVRDPISRLVSCFGLIQRHRQHRLHQAVSATGMSFETYLRSGIDTQTDNGQVRQIAGCLYTLEFGRCSRTHLERAQEHIEKRFLLAGTTEAYDKVLVMLASLLGWQRITNVPRNSNGRASNKVELSDSLQQELVERNALDRELFEFVSRRFGDAFDNDRAAVKAFHRFRMVEAPLRALAPVRRARENLGIRYRALR